MTYTELLDILEEKAVARFGEADPDRLSRMIGVLDLLRVELTLDQERNSTAGV